MKKLILLLTVILTTNIAFSQCYKSVYVQPKYERVERVITICEADTDYVCHDATYKTIQVKYNDSKPTNQVVTKTCNGVQAQCIQEAKGCGKIVSTKIKLTSSYVDAIYTPKRIKTIWEWKKVKEGYIELVPYKCH
jgi:hypothetical protein